jgi:hypothetical protein
MSRDCFILLLLCAAAELGAFTTPVVLANLIALVQHMSSSILLLKHC